MLLERCPPRGIGVAWPLLVSKFLRVIEFGLGLITCERCMSSVTTKTSECVMCAVYDSGMDTQRLPSTAVAIRKAMAVYQ